MKRFPSYFWLILAVLPFAVPVLLLAVYWVVAPPSSFPAAQVAFSLVTNYWWLILFVVFLVDCFAYIIHAQHSTAIPDELRREWTMWILFFPPIANIAYYTKFIAPKKDRDV